MNAAPRYIRVVHQLRRDIIEGRLHAGQEMPSEMAVADRFDVSRTTARRAIGELSAEGLIVVRHGVGATVTDTTLPRFTYYASRSESHGRRATAHSDAYVTDVTEAGSTPTQDYATHMVEAPKWVADRLNVAPGSTCTLRRCWRYIDGEPSSRQDSYYPQWVTSVAPELQSPHDIAVGTTRMLADNHGIHQVGYVDENELLPRTTVGADSARWSMELENWFVLPAGMPMMVQIRTAYTATDPVRVTETIWPGNRVRVVYELGDLTALAEGDDDDEGGAA